jgi:hypothetical protein
MNVVDHEEICTLGHATVAKIRNRFRLICLTFSVSYVMFFKKGNDHQEWDFGQLSQSG